MSIVDISLDLENLPDGMLKQLGQGGDPRYPGFLVAAEVQRRKDMRDRHQAQEQKRMAEKPDIMAQRYNELGIPGADPNMEPGDPSLQTGIAAATGGLIPRYQEGGGFLGDDPLGGGMRTESDWNIQRGISGQPLVLEVTSPEELRARLEDFDASRLGARRSEAEQLYLDQRREELGSAAGLMKDEELLGGFEFKPTFMESVRDFGQGLRRGTGHDAALRRLAKLDDTDMFRAVQAGVRAGMPLAEALERYEKNIGVTPDVDTTTPLSEEELLARREPGPLLPPGEPGEPGEPGPSDWLDALTERDEAQWQRKLGLLDRGFDEVTRVEDLMVNRTPEDLAFDRSRRGYGDEEQKRARGIASLRGDRSTEMTRLLAEKMGVTEDRVNELQAIDSLRTGQAADRFKSGAFGAALGGDWDKAAKSIEEAGTRIRSEEDERSKGIYDELMRGREFEEEGEEDIFDLGLETQQDLDIAELARLGLDRDMLQETADRPRKAARDLLDARMGLYGAGVREEGANWRASLAEQSARDDRASAEQVARTNLTNYAADPNNWDAIEIIFDDIIQTFDKNDPMVQQLIDAKQRVGMKTISGLEGELPVSSRQITNSAGLIRLLSDQLSRLPADSRGLAAAMFLNEGARSQTAE